MAEYMDYNDYDYEFKTKKHRRNANIRLALAILFIAFVVVWTFTHLPENIRTGFDSVYSSEHTIGEKIDKNSGNEFVLFNNAFKNDEKVNFENDFKEKYPQISALATMKKLDISKEKVLTFDESGYFVIAYTYEVQREKDSNGNYYDEGREYIVGTTGVDFYIFEYDINGGFVINKPERFSIRLHAGQNDLVPYIEKVYVKSESFRLNFYSLSVVVKSENEISEIKTTVHLESGINKEEFEDNFFTSQQFVKSIENQDLIGTIENIKGGGRGDTYLNSRIALKTPMKEIEVGMNFDDAVYNKFIGYKIDEIKNGTYTIKVN